MACRHCLKEIPQIHVGKNALMYLRSFSMAPVVDVANGCPFRIPLDPPFGDTVAATGPSQVYSVLTSLAAPTAPTLVARMALNAGECPNPFPQLGRLLWPRLDRLLWPRLDRLLWPRLDRLWESLVLSSHQTYRPNVRKRKRAHGFLKRYALECAT
jgi:hypothetical protein